MTHDLTIEGVTYISSRRASEMTGYSQDYIGQLARSGKIQGKRIGGLWYVLSESLLGHKKVAESYIPTPPNQEAQVRTVAAEDSSMVTFEGKMYVSASRAAKLTTYHQDYIGQLARSGKILSKQVGRRWYIDIEALKEHKKEKDSLLGAVQASSVGLDHISQEKRDEIKQEEALDVGLHYKYVTETKPLMPLMPIIKESEYKEEHESQSQEEHSIPIRIVKQQREIKIVPESEISTQKRGSRMPRISIFLKLFPVIIAIIVAVGAFNISLPNLNNSVLKERQNISIFNSKYPDLGLFMAQSQSYFLGIFSKRITYSRESS